MSTTLTYTHIYLQAGAGTTSPQKILIGNMAELVTDKFRCLGLLALPDFTDEQHLSLGAFADTVFERGPFATLERMFDEAWEEAGDGEALAWLAKSYQLTILVEPPVFLEPPLLSSYDELEHEAAVSHAMEAGWEYQSKTSQKRVGDSQFRA